MAVRSSPSVIRVPFLHRLFAVFVLVMSTKPFMYPRTVGGGTEATGGGAALRYYWAVVGLFVLIIVVTRGRLRTGTWRRLVGSPFLPAVVLLCVVSAGWSLTPAFTLQKSVSLVVTVLVAVYIGIQFDLGDQVGLLNTALLALMMASLLTVLLIPGLGLEQGFRGPEVRGAFENKNLLGRYAGLSVLVGLTAWRMDRKASGSILMAAAVVLLAITPSITSWSGVFAALSLIPLLRFARLRPRAAIGLLSLGLLTVIVAGTWALLNYAAILAALGRNPDLTGRVPFWAVLVTQIEARPVVGYGYHGFWHGWDGPSRTLWMIFPWHPTHAHNGFLDAILNVGGVGFALLSLYLIRSARDGVVWLRSTVGAVGEWPLLLMAYVVTINFSYSTLLAGNNLFWILWVSTATALVGHRFQSAAPGTPNITLNG
mgnify:CR=1 FL=1